MSKITIEQSIVLLSGIKEEVTKMMGDLSVSNFDISGSAIISYLINESVYQNPSDDEKNPINEYMCQLNMNQISKKILISRKVIKHRLVFLSRVGLIMLIRHDKKTIYSLVNPYTFRFFEKSIKPEIKKSFYRYYSETFVRRHDSYENLQGFKTDVLLYEREFIKGEKETDTAKIIATTHSLKTVPVETAQDSKVLHHSKSIPSQNGDTKIQDNLKRIDFEINQKKKTNYKWRELDARFIRAAASVWIQCQVKFGYGSAKPLWQEIEKVTELTSQGRRLRQDLTKLFHQYGGKVTALAWLIFMGQQPELDKRGQPYITNRFPYRQYSTIAKRPDQFDKYFSELLNDPDFITYSTEKWPVIQPILKRVFGEILDIEPKDSDASLKNKLSWQIDGVLIKPFPDENIKPGNSKPF